VKTSFFPLSFLLHGLLLFAQVNENFFIPYFNDNTELMQCQGFIREKYCLFLKLSSQSHGLTLFLTPERKIFISETFPSPQTVRQIRQE
jgi:hypothetical protein